MILTIGVRFDVCLYRLSEDSRCECTTTGLGKETGFEKLAGTAGVPPTRFLSLCLSAFCLTRSLLTRFLLSLPLYSSLQILCCVSELAVALSTPKIWLLARLRPPL